MVKLNEYSIKLTNSIYHISTSSPDILTQLPHNQIEIYAYSLLPKYTTTLVVQLLQTPNEPGQFGAINQGLVKYIIVKYNDVEYLPQRLH